MLMLRRRGDDKILFKLRHSGRFSRNSNHQHQTSTSTPMSTRANPEGLLTWLFFDLKNAKSSVHSMTIPGHALRTTTVEKLDWIGDFKLWFKFRVDMARIDFWTVG